MLDIKQITQVLSSYDTITNALVFGSFAKGTQTKMSDLDIAIETKNDMSLLSMGAIISDLETICKRKIDLIILNSLPCKAPLLAFNIYKNHIPIFINDKNSYNKFNENALHHFLDFKPVLQAQNETFTQRILDGNLAKTKTA